MSDKDLIVNRATLDLTQKIQKLFPLDLELDVLRAWNECSEEFLQSYLKEIFSKMPRKRRLLKFSGSIEIPAATSLFIVKEKFAVNTSKEAKVKNSYIGRTFQERFLGSKQIIREIDYVSSAIHFYSPLERSTDNRIIDELGGKEIVESNLYSMSFLMEKQGHGQGGILLSDGYANIFYIRDDEGVLWAIDLLWDGAGWSIDADSTDTTDPKGFLPRKRHSANRIFSNNLLQG